MNVLYADEQMEERKIIVLSVVATFLTSTFGFLLAGHFPVGDRIYTYGDYYVQYIQFIRLFWRELFTTGDLVYSFSASMGQPTAALYAYYCLSPCNLFFAFIRDADTAAYLTMLAKQLLAAGTFAMFCRRVLKTKGLGTVAFAAFYAQCGYLVVHFSHINLMDSLYFLPLILLLMYHYVISGKWYPLCVAYTASFIVCFYGGYQTGIFSFLILLLMMWYYYGKPSTQWFGPLGRYVVCVLIAVMISAVVTLPAAYHIVLNNNVGNTEYRPLGVHFWDVIACMFLGRNYGAYGKAPMIYTGLPVFFIMPAFLFLKAANRRQKLLFVLPFVFLLLCTFIKPLYLLMHAFDMPDGNYFRFAYMFSFLFASMCAWQIEQLEGTIKRMWILGIVFFITGTYILIAFLQKIYPIGDGHEEMNMFGLGVNLCIALVYAVFFWKEKWHLKLHTVAVVFVCVALSENILNIFMTNAHDGDGFERRRDYYRLWNQQGEESMDMISHLESGDSGFYRIRYDNPQSTNNAAFWGYNGIGYFSTLEQKELKQLLYRLGYYISQKAEMKDYGGTELTQAFFSQKYRVHGTNPSFETEDEFAIERNELALPLAYIVDDDILDYNAGSQDPFDNQERLLSAMIGEECRVFERYAGQPDIEFYNVTEAWFDNGKGWVVEDTDVGYGYIIMRIPPSNMRGYVYFSQDGLYPYEDSARVMTNKDAGWPIGESYLYTPHILELGEGKSEKYDTMIVIDHMSVPFANYGDAYFYYLDKKKLTEKIDELRQEGVELRIDKGHNLYGDSNTNGGILFTSIPYDKGWKAYIDGNRTDTFSLCEGAFLGIRVPEGKYRLSFVYEDKSVRLGVYISLMGSVFFLICLYSDKRKGKSNGAI